MVWCDSPGVADEGQLDPVPGRARLVSTPAADSPVPERCLWGIRRSLCLLRPRCFLIGGLIAVAPLVRGLA